MSKEQIEQMVDDLMACHTEFYENGELYTDYPDMAENMIAKGGASKSGSALTRGCLKYTKMYCVMLTDILFMWILYVQTVSGVMMKVEQIK